MRPLVSKLLMSLQESNTGVLGRRYRHFVACTAKSAERGDDSYLDDDAVLILVKRLLLQVRTELVVPPTDATA